VKQYLTDIERDKRTHILGYQLMEGFKEMKMQQGK